MDVQPDPIRADLVRDAARRALAVPAARALDPVLLDPADPAAGVTVTPGDAASNGAGGTHSAAQVAALELAGYLAVAPQLGPDEHAVSVSIAVQLLAPMPLGTPVVVTGRADPRGGRLAFVTAEASCGGRVVARAQLTKAIVRT